MAVSEKKDFGWVKQVYYYIVLLVCVLYLGIGSFIILKSNLVHFVFTKIEDQNYSYYSSDHNCVYEGDYRGYENEYPLLVKDVTGETYEREKLTEEDRQKCLKVLEKDRDDAIEADYQEDMLSSILMVVIPGVILGLHVKYVRPTLESKKSGLTGKKTVTKRKKK